MIVCNQCGNQLGDKSRFCNKCGEPVSKAKKIIFCRECGAQMDFDATTCEKCGTFFGASQLLQQESEAGTQVLVGYQEQAITQPTFSENSQANIMPVYDMQHAHNQNNVIQYIENQNELTGSVIPNNALIGTSDMQMHYGNRRFCRKCGFSVKALADRCTACGAKVGKSKNRSDKKTKTKGEVKYVNKSTKSGKNKKGKNRIIAIGSIAAIAIIVVVSYFLFIKKDNTAKECAMYTKDTQLMYTEFSNKNSLTVTDNISGKEGDKNISYYSYCVLRNNILFYAEDVGANESFGVFSLYYKNTSKATVEGNKISSDVVVYQVNNNASIITYEKSDGRLYQYNMRVNDKEKIDDDISYFFQSDDGTYLYYLNNKGSFYVKKIGQEAIKIANDVSDFSVDVLTEKIVYYRKNGNVYKYIYGTEEENIASDVSRILKGYGGKLYYEKSSNLTGMDLVDDDVDKSNKTEIRDRLKEIKPYSQVYFYDGKYEIMLFQYVSYGYETPIYFSYTSSVLIAKGIGENSDKIKMSDIGANTDTDLGTELEKANSSVFIISDGCVSNEIHIDGYIMTLGMDYYGENYYYTSKAEYDDEDCDLYYGKVNGKGSNEKYDTLVSPYNIGFTKKGLIYSKESDRDSYRVYYDLWMNKNKIANEADYYIVSDDGEKVCFITDYSNENYLGTLNYYDGKNVIKIEEDVSSYSYAFSPKGKLLYFHDYSGESACGDLYCYNGKTKVLLDYDVHKIVTPITSNDEAGAGYYNYYYNSFVFY